MLPVAGGVTCWQVPHNLRKDHYIMHSPATALLRFVLTSVLASLSLTSLWGGTAQHVADAAGDTATDHEIREGLFRMNDLLATKDLMKVMTLYDDSDDIAVIGSDSGEVFVGRERVRTFMKMIVSMPFVFSFDMDHPVINHDGNIAWVFVDANMVHTRSSGKVTRFPYRVTAIMVKRNDGWKWKMFSGSIPRSE
jgi:ketosteroid isomerase-like protein